MGPDEDIRVESLVNNCRSVAEKQLVPVVPDSDRAGVGLEPAFGRRATPVAAATKAWNLGKLNFGPMPQDMLSKPNCASVGDPEQKYARRQAYALPFKAGLDRTRPAGCPVGVR